MGAFDIGGAIAKFVSALVQWAGFFFAFRLGKRKEQAKQAEATARIKDEQMEIAARPVEHRGDIIDRMRNGGL